MDKRKYKKSDKDVRSALWLAYGKKDVYSGDLLRYREMEVDHIVPQEIFKNEERKLEVLKLLGLDSDFEKDSLENYVPTRRGPNSSKGDSVDLILIKNTLNKAQRMKSKVEQLIMEYNEECDFINVTTKVALLADSEEKKQDAADIIFDEEEEFEDEESLIGCQFTKSIRRVRIHAFFPTLKDNTPSCTFMFRPLKLRECTVTVNHDEIFSKLFIANGEYEDLSERPFVGYKMDDGSHIIYLGGCSFYLSESETKELCEIVDRYNELYFQKLKEIEEKYSLDGMKINRFAEIKICVLKKDFCKIVFDFINNKKSNDKWNIFEPNRAMIKVYTDKDNMEYNEGYHAIIHVREEEESLFWYSDRDVGLYLKTYYDEPQCKLSPKDWWTPTYVRQWLFNELFPACLEEYYKNMKQKVSKQFDFVDECKRYCTPQQCKKIRITNRNDMVELNTYIRLLQCFYSIQTHRRLKFLKGSEGLYNSFLILLKGCTEKLYLPYIMGNLGITESTLDSLYGFIYRKKAENLGKLSYSQIELLLRCFIECVEKGMANLSQEDYIAFWEGMEELITEYNYHTMREWFI